MAYDYSEYFVELKENKVNLFSGEAVFTLRNPVEDDNLILSNNNLNAVFNKVEGDIDSFTYFLYITHNITNNKWVFDYECDDLFDEINQTNYSSCVDNGYFSDIVEERSDWVELIDGLEYEVEPFDVIDVKLIAHFEKSIYERPVKIDWFSVVKDNTFFFNIFNQEYVSEEWAWFDADKLYETPINVSVSTGSTGEPFLINITYNASIMNVDFSDIAIANPDRTVELPIWNESQENGAWLYLWILPDANITTSNTTLYMYSGNTTPSTLNVDGYAVFDFFDDFDSPTLNASTWDIQGTKGSTGDYIIYGGSLHLWAIASNTLFGLSGVYNVSTPSTMTLSINGTWTGNWLYNWYSFGKGLSHASRDNQHAIQSYTVSGTNSGKYMFRTYAGSNTDTNTPYYSAGLPQLVKTLTYYNSSHAEWGVNHTEVYTHTANIPDLSAGANVGFGQQLSGSSNQNITIDFIYAYDNIIDTDFSYGFGETVEEAEEEGNLTISTVSAISVVIDYDDVISVNEISEINISMTLPEDYTNITYKIIGKGLTTEEDVNPTMTTYISNSGGISITEAGGGGGFGILEVGGSIIQAISSSTEIKETSMIGISASEKTKIGNPVDEDNEVIEIPEVIQNPKKTANPITPPFPENPTYEDILFKASVKFDEEGLFGYYILVSGVNESDVNDTFIARSNGASVLVGSPFTVDDSVAETDLTSDNPLAFMEQSWFWVLMVVAILLLIGVAIFFKIKG